MVKTREYRHKTDGYAYWLEDGVLICAPICGGEVDYENKLYEEDLCYPLHANKRKSIMKHLTRRHGK